MLDSLLQLIHVLASMVWLGGMFFAHFCLRPAAQQLEPPVRIGLLCGVLQRFFTAVTVAIAALLASGIWMLGRTARQVVQSGGQFSLPLDWALMVAIGLVMTGIFGYIRLVLFKQLVLAKEAGNWPEAGRWMAKIKTWVATNLGLGVAIVAFGDPAVVPCWRRVAAFVQDAEARLTASRCQAEWGDLLT